MLGSVHYLCELFANLKKLHDPPLMDEKIYIAPLPLEKKVTHHLPSISPTLRVT